MLLCLLRLYFFLPFSRPGCFLPKAKRDRLDKLAFVVRLYGYLWLEAGLRVLFAGGA